MRQQNQPTIVVKKEFTLREQVSMDFLIMLVMQSDESDFTDLVPLKDLSH